MDDWRTAIAILLILLTPIAGANTIQDFTFSDGEFTDSASFAGQPSSLQFQDLKSPQSFQLTGTLRIEAEYLESDIRIQGFTAQSRSDSETLFEGPIALGGTFRDFADLLVTNIQAAGTMESPQGTIEQLSGSREWLHNLQPTYPKPTASLDGLPTIAIQKSTEIQLNGSFELSLWNTELSNENQEFWSGDRTAPYNPNTPSQIEAGTNKRQVLHIYVEQGNLYIPTLNHEISTSWNKVNLEGKGLLSLENAIDLAGTQIGSIKATEDWAMNLGKGNALTARDFESSNLEVNGITVQSAPSSNYWWWASILFVIPIGLLLKNTSRAQIHKMERNLNHSRYEKVAARPIKRLLNSKHGSRASLYRATSLLALGLYQEAALFLESLKQTSRPDPATYHFLYAHALASQGQRIDAGRHLNTCLKLAPEYIREAEAIKALQPILGLIGATRAETSESYS